MSSIFILSVFHPNVSAIVNICDRMAEQIKKFLRKNPWALRSYHSFMIIHIDHLEFLLSQLSYHGEYSNMFLSISEEKKVQIFDYQKSGWKSIWVIVKFLQIYGNIWHSPVSALYQLCRGRVCQISKKFQKFYSKWFFCRCIE